MSILYLFIDFQFRFRCSQKKKSSEPTENTYAQTHAHGSHAQTPIPEKYRCYWFVSIFQNRINFFFVRKIKSIYEIQVNWKPENPRPKNQQRTEIDNIGVCVTWLRAKKVLRQIKICFIFRSIRLMCVIVAAKNHVKKFRLFAVVFELFSVVFFTLFSRSHRCLCILLLLLLLLLQLNCIDFITFAPSFYKSPKTFGCLYLWNLGCTYRECVKATWKQVNKDGNRRIQNSIRRPRRKKNKLWKVRDKTAENGISFERALRACICRWWNTKCSRASSQSYIVSFSISCFVLHFFDIAAAAIHILIVDLFSNRLSCRAECNITNIFASISHSVN